VTAPRAQSGQRRDKAEDDDWEWRRKIRANRRVYPVYKAAVIVVGFIITIGGLALVPLPGPGWLIVFFGIAVLGSEFEPAQRLLEWGKERLQQWTDWLSPKPWWFKGLVGLATLALVLAIFWGLFALSGVPGWFPDAVETRMMQLPGLGR
jgi:uncharacterized protein (TIGR02611 family)